MLRVNRGEALREKGKKVLLALVGVSVGLPLILTQHPCMHGQLTSPCSTSGKCAFQSNLLLPFLAQLSMIITTQKQTHTHIQIHLLQVTSWECTKITSFFISFSPNWSFFLALHTKARILLCFDSFYRVYSSSLRDFGPLSNNIRSIFIWGFFQRWYIFGLVLKPEIRSRVIISLKNFGFFLEDFFFEDYVYFCRKYLSFCNSSFALRYVLM